MKIYTYSLLLTGLLFATMSFGEETIRSFYLEGVRTGKQHGPFPFQTNSRITLSSGTFRLDVLSQKGNFLLTDEDTGNVFGVYELVPGRIIDAGYKLFTISGIHLRTPPPPAAQSEPPPQPRSRPQPTTRPSPQPRTPSRIPPSAATTISPSRLQRQPAAPRFTAGVTFDLFSQIAYEWSINGQDRNSAPFIERRGATLYLTTHLVTVEAGLLTEGEWKETFDDPFGVQFEDATLTRGTGWKAAIKLDLPLWQEDRWSASASGRLQHQEESFTLAYGTWQSEPTATNAPSDGGTNDVPLIPPSPRWQRTELEDDATLAETLLSFGLQIDYQAPGWFCYAGLHVWPWTDTELDATIQGEFDAFSLDFSRRDPVSAFGGLGFRYQQLHAYAEAEAGGVNRVRLGLYIPF